MRYKILQFVNEYRQKPLQERLQRINIIRNSSPSYTYLEQSIDTDLIFQNFKDYSRDTINDNIIGLKELDFIEANCNLQYSIIFRIKEKGYAFLENSEIEKTLKIEITNTQPIVDALVAQTSISKEFGEKLIEQLKVFNRLQEENNFYKADEIEVLKIQLQELKKENSEVNWDLLLGIIGLIQPLLK